MPPACHGTSSPPRNATFPQILRASSFPPWLSAEQISSLYSLAFSARVWHLPPFERRSFLLRLDYT